MDGGKQMRRFLSLITVIALLLSLSACSEKGANQAIYYTLSQSPSTLDPQYANDTGAYIVINNTFEGLVRFSENGEIIPGIAESWVISPDGLTYTFTLKPDTEWYCPVALKNEFGSDFYDKFSKEKVTANDFVFAMQRAVSPETGSPNAHRLFVIENAAEIFSGKLGIEALGVYAPDNTTLVIKLAEPCSDMLQRLTESVFMPCNEEFFNAMGGRYGLSNRNILCNGPFYVGAWDNETALTIRKNKYYSGSQAVMPLSVNFDFDYNLKTITEEISGSSLSAALLPPDCEIPENSLLIKENPNSSFGICFNCSDTYLKNINLRLALCYAIDRSLFASENAIPLSGFVPANCSVGSLNYGEVTKNQTLKIDKDTAAAAQHWNTALSELGKEKISLTVLCPEWLDSAVRRQLQIWQQTMGIGLGITIENKTPDEIRAAVNSGNYQIALTGVESPYDSAVDFLASFADGNIFRYSSDEYDMIIDRLLIVEDESDLLRGCYTAEGHILQQAVCYPLYSRSSRFVTAEDIDGITILNSESSISFIGAKRYD